MSTADPLDVPAGVRHAAHAAAERRCDQRHGRITQPELLDAAIDTTWAEAHRLPPLSNRDAVPTIVQAMARQAANDHAVRADGQVTLIELLDAAVTATWRHARRLLTHPGRLTTADRLDTLADLRERTSSAWPAPSQHQPEPVGRIAGYQPDRTTVTEPTGVFADMLARLEADPQTPPSLLAAGRNALGMIQRMEADRG